MQANQHLQRLAHGVEDWICCKAAEKRWVWISGWGNFCSQLWLPHSSACYVCSCTRKLRECPILTSLGRRCFNPSAPSPSTFAYSSTNPAGHSKPQEDITEMNHLDSCRIQHHWVCKRCPPLSLSLTKGNLDSRPFPPTTSQNGIKSTTTTTKKKKPQKTQPHNRNKHSHLTVCVPAIWPLLYSESHTTRISAGIRWARRDLLESAAG